MRNTNQIAEIIMQNIAFHAPTAKLRSHFYSADQLRTERSGVRIPPGTPGLLVKKDAHPYEPVFIRVVAVFGLCFFT